MTNGNKLHHPDITEDMRSELDRILEVNKTRPGSIITVLRECQSVVGYLPLELMDYISRGVNLPRSDVFGVASFYSLFSMEPKGRHSIKMCTGTACYVKGIKEVINRVVNEYGIEDGETTDDRRFSLDSVRCLGACGLAPVMVVNEDTHGAVSSDKVIDILENYS